MGRRLSCDEQSQMKITSIRQISDAEMEVLKTLWEHGPSTIRQVHNLLEVQGRAWADNTVLTLMSRLRDKQIVKRDGVKSPHVFRAIVTREKLLSHRLGHL